MRFMECFWVGKDHNQAIFKKKKDNEQQYTNDGKEARNVLIRS